MLDITYNNKKSNLSTKYLNYFCAEYLKLPSLHCKITKYFID